MVYNNKGVNKYSLQEIKEAGLRVDRSSKGSDGEYVNHIALIYKKMKSISKL